MDFSFAEFLKISPPRLFLILLNSSAKIGQPLNKSLEMASSRSIKQYKSNDYKAAIHVAIFSKKIILLRFL